MRNPLYKLSGFTKDLILSKSEIILFSLVGAFCFFVFLHGDIILTSRSSIKYLNGHFLDFYDVSRNVYPPATYIIFAIWNIPLYILGFVTDLYHYAKFAHFWWKLLPVLFFIGSGWVIRRIGLISKLSNKDASVLSLLWLTHPIAFYAIVIFGQYGSITVFFTLLGVLYYLQSRLLLSSIIFGIAFCFKPFPAFIFLILILLREKNILKIMGYGVVSIIPYVLLVLPYLSSVGFRKNAVGSDLYHRIFETKLSLMTPNSVYLFFMIFAFLVGYAYLKRSESDDDIIEWALFLPLVVYSLFFTTVRWHAQWLIHMIPFMVILAYRRQNVSGFMLADLVMMFLFVGYTVCRYPYNADQNLMYRGILNNSGLLSAINPDFINFANANKPVMADVFYNDKRMYLSCFLGILWLYSVQVYPKTKVLLEKNYLYSMFRKNRVLFGMRFVIGTGLFVIPALYVMFVSSPVYNIVNMPVPNGHRTVGQLKTDDDIRQYFTAVDDTISAVSLQFGTYGDSRGGLYEFLIYDHKDHILFRKKFSLQEIKNNQIKKFRLPFKINTNKRELYSFGIKALEVSHTSRLTLYCSYLPRGENAYVTMNGKKLTWNLRFGIDP